jgi:uncharacterized delta-60 repeat protein
MLTRIRLLTWKAGLLAAILSLLAFTVAQALSGDLDSTFDGDGLVTSYAAPSNPARNDLAWGVAIQTNGKIVVAGNSYSNSTNSDFAVLRYNPNGSLDTTFSGDGRLLTNFGANDAAYEVAIQSDGKIVVAGQTCNTSSNICDVALARYKAGGGSLDTTFSGDGKQTTDFGGSDNGSIGGLAIDSNGKIVVAGYKWNGTNYEFAVYRYLSNGSLDTTFSGDGKASIGFGAGRQNFATDLVIQSDGKIVVSGFSGDANYANNNFAVARLNSNGSLDNSFSGDGRLTTNFGADDYAYNVALQADGKIVLAGEKTTASLTSVALARYNTSGSLDTTFNGTGRKVFNLLAGKASWAEGLVAQANGSLVVMGTMVNGSNALDFFLVRLNTGGGFDSTFSGDGKVTVNFGNDEFAGDLVLQANGRYVLGGYTRDSTQIDFAVARVLP